MEAPAQAPAQGQTPPSEFSGQKYNPDANSVKHYKAGKKPGGKAKKKKKQPDYAQTSVFQIQKGK